MPNLFAVFWALLDPVFGREIHVWIATPHHGYLGLYRKMDPAPHQLGGSGGDGIRIEIRILIRWVLFFCIFV